MRIDMNWKSGIYALAAVIMLAAGPAWAGCSAGDRIDGTTVDQVKHKIVAAGYSQVSGLKKGCDNYWHAIAMKDGASIGVVVSGIAVLQLITSIRCAPGSKTSLSNAAATVANPKAVDARTTWVVMPPPADS
jgi:hypothetical protein